MPTPESYRDQLIAALREEQLTAQQRTIQAKEQGTAPDPFDRDVAGWLANGLCDLFTDRITGESFLREGQGTIARLADGADDVRFTEANFQRPEGIKFLDASRPAQSMLTKLSMISTNQFRAAAARLMNQIVERLLVPAEAIPEPLPMPTPVVEEVPPIEVVPPVIETPQREPLPVESFVRRGLVNRDELPSNEDGLRELLVSAWQRWFAKQIALIDAEELLAFEEIEQFSPTIAEVQDAWFAGRTIELPLPRSEMDFLAAEKMFDNFRWLRLEWTIYDGPYNEAQAFDAAVEAGGAPLGMLTKFVKYWLKKENKDWKKYKIVKGE